MSYCAYGKLLPDNLDLNNRSGKRPGYRLYVREFDGGIELSMVGAELDPVTNPGSQVFMTIAEAKELIEGLKDAIDYAKQNKKHKR